MRIIIEIDDKQVASYSDGEVTGRVQSEAASRKESKHPPIDGGAAAPTDNAQTEAFGEIRSSRAAEPKSASDTAESAGAAPDA